MAWEKITVTEFKDYFTRDFPYGADPALHVLDSDIQRAIDEGFLKMYQGLYDTQEQFNHCSYYLAAHLLVMNIKASGSGLNGQADWATGSKSVGSVSTSSAIPSAISEDPIFAMLSRSQYGQRYLECIIPLMSGTMFTTEGMTHA